MRFQAAASLLQRRDRGRRVSRRADARAGASSARCAYAGAAVDEQGDHVGARVLQPLQRRRPGRRSGRSSTTGPSASACCARCCSPAPTHRSADAARLQRLARHPCRAARRRRPPRPDPRARARRARGVRARGGLSRRDLLAGGVGLLLAANGVPGLSTRGVLEAAAAQAAAAPDAPILVSLYLDGGNDGLNTLVPLDRPALRGAALAHRRRPGDCAAVAATTPSFGWHPSLAGPARALRRGQGRRAARGRLLAPRPVALQLRRLLAQRHRRAGARPHRLARPHARRGRHARQPAPGHPRRLGPGSVAERSPRARRNACRRPRLRLLHPGRLGREGVSPDLPPALAGTREAPGLAAVRTMYGNTIDTHDRLAPLAKEDKPPPPPVAVSRQRPRQGARQPRRACSAPASARASPRSRAAASTRTTRRPRRTPICCRTSATRCAPGRPTSTRAGSRRAS